VSIGLSVLDASMANVALPTIASEMGVSASSVVWVLNAYGLTVLVLLLPMSSVGERIGFKRLLKYGLTLFVLAAAGSALSQSLPVLILFRVLQGVGAAAVMCLFGALVRHIYPLKLMARGIGINAMMVGVTSAVGPSLGAMILSVASWHWIFAFNLPLSLLAFYGLRYLPDHAPTQNKFDWVAALLTIISIGLLVIGINYLVVRPMESLLSILVGLSTGVVLIRRSSLQTAPLVPVDLFRISTMRYAVAASACTFAAQMSTFVALPFYFQQAMGRSLISVGFLMMGWPAGAAIMAGLAGFFSDRYPVSVLCGLGALTMGLGMGFVVLAPSSFSDFWFLLALFCAGCGFGFFQTPNNRVLIVSAPRNRAGAVGGLQATTRVLGQTFGAAVVASMFSLSKSTGPLLGMVVGMAFASLAVVINVVRYFQGKQESGRA
jgi:DHA2 family multidrug resistance protein-like MFS transporter